MLITANEQNNFGKNMAANTAKQTMQLAKCGFGASGCVIQMWA